MEQDDVVRSFAVVTKEELQMNRRTRGLATTCISLALVTVAVGWFAAVDSVAGNRRSLAPQA